ncbi:hypothetical protein KBTX_02583 [wastewater metagenome]|uniref:Phasin domain-containing protein n=2 Tax=unclassified sequences TaxID=12908 RepID=A0A5B8RDS2_9ZZZZ|nr:MULTISPECIES: phasin family protein [Arhodomonas]MCS4503400.1 phasin family protein [Arhodomonas aquaeolei]QEA06253.1 hypothetical protein KBTEX_02583 [uncultured organism]
METGPETPSMPRPDWSAMLTPQRELMEAWLGFAEQLTRLHMDTMRRCMELALEETRCMMAVHDERSLQDYWQHQRGFLEELDTTIGQELQGVRSLGERLAREVTHTAPAGEGETRANDAA